MKGGIFAQINSSWATRVYRDELLSLQVDGTEGSAVAGLRECKVQHRANTPRPVWNPDLPNPFSFAINGPTVPDNAEFDNAFKVQWEMFLRHVAADAPFPHDFLDGARGVQLAELAHEFVARAALGRCSGNFLRRYRAGVIRISTETGQVRMADKIKALAESDHDGPLERGRGGGGLRAARRAVDCAVAAQDSRRQAWPRVCAWSRTPGCTFPAFAAAECFPRRPKPERRRNIEDNFRAADEAAALNADSLVMVVGGCAGSALEEARKMVADGSCGAGSLCAASAACASALSRFIPCIAAERSVLVTIGQALELAPAYDAREVGVVLDTFHIWWDPQVEELIAQAAGRIYGFHVSDWLVPLPDMLMGRGLMGDGVIDNRKLRLLVEQAGYTGPIEVEIFNRALWDADPDAVLTQVIERFEKFV